MPAARSTRASSRSAATSSATDPGAATTTLAGAHGTSSGKNATPAAGYARWRRRTLGRVTDVVEHRLVLEGAGPVTGRCVLDSGCGDGDLAVALAAAGAHVAAVDSDPRVLAAADRRAARAGAAIGLCAADLRALPFADASFDVAIAITVLCLVHPRAEAVRELARVLRPGGRLVVGELNRWSVWAAWRCLRDWLGHPVWSSARPVGPEELRRLVADAGLNVGAVRMAVMYPPWGPAARLLAPHDTCWNAISALAALSSR